ncbi:unnamed protein product [Caenorhabditis brenneri]
MILISHLRVTGSKFLRLENLLECLYNSSIDSYVKSHLPGPTSRCDVFDCYNDVMDVIVRFSETTQVPICGARIFFLLKRETDVIDPPDQVDGLRKYHITATFAISNTPVGGEEPGMLSLIASLTNGFCEYNNDGSMQMSYLPACYTPYLVYAANALVGGKSSIQLPQLIVPKEIPSGYYPRERTRRVDSHRNFAFVEP